MLKGKVLVTPRLILRPIEEKDAQELYNILSDEETTRFLTLPIYESIENANAWIAKCVETEGEGTHFYRAIELKETGALIGGIGVELDADNNSGELGFYLNRDFWRQGFMSEAVEEMIRFLLLEEGINRISACHSVRNPASGGVMRKAGMSYEGMARELRRNRLGYQDCHRYAILKSDLAR